MTIPDYLLLIHKQLTGSITPEEHDLLNAWENANEENHRIAEETRQAWELAEGYQKDLPYDQAHELDRLMGRIGRDEIAVPGKRPSRNIFNSNTVLKYAASLLFVAGAVYYGKQLMADPKPTPVVVKLTTAESTILPDSSTVQLNKNSTIQYSGDFTQRNVQLTGEAYFNVKSDPQNPFRIKTNLATITVVGTSFNVRADSTEDEMTVVVTSGIVEVTTVRGKELIRPGEKCIVRKANGTPDKAVNTDQNFLAWQTKIFEYKKARLETVFKDMERYYGVVIKVENTQVLNCLFNGSFHNASLEEAIDVLTFAFDIKMEKVNAKLIRVTGNPCKGQTV